MMSPPLRSACSACRERGAKVEQTRLIDGAGGSDVESAPPSDAASWADVYALPPLPPDGAVGASGAAEGDDSCSESDGSDDDDDEVAGGEAPLAYATVKLCAEAPRSRSPPLAARVVLAEPRVPPAAIVEVSFTGKML